VIVKKPTMTEKERIKALLRREKPDRVPLFPFAAKGFSMVYSNASIADAYNNPEVSLAAQRKTARDFGWVHVPMLGYAALGSWEFGGDIKWPTSEFDQAPTVSRRAVQTVEDVWNLKLPDVKTAGITPISIDFYKKAVQDAHDNEPWGVSNHVEGAFNVAANIAGVDMLARWLIREPKAAHRLLGLATDFLIERARYMKELFGVENVHSGGGEPSASNQVISPKHFRDFALPYLKKEYESVLAIGFDHICIHICGEQNMNLPYWAEIPFGNPGFISIGHEVDLETAAKYFPNDIIMGNIEPAIIQTSTPDGVYEESRRIIEKGKKLPCGYVFSPGCELPPKAPLENVMAMTRAINDYGWY
jgi:uroporphyrinogen decarboxylase